MKCERPSITRIRQVRGAPAAPPPGTQGSAKPEPVFESPGGAGRLGRIGAPSLIALGSAIALVALLACALLIPGFVLPAAAETTSSTQVVPDSAGPDGPTRSVSATATPTALASTKPSTGSPLVTLAWGDGLGQVGLARATEGLTRGPEGLAVAPDGRIAVLDAVNSRLVLLSPQGGTAGTIALSLKEPRFLAADDQTICVLDADADHQVVSFDWRGQLLHSAGLPKLDDVVTGLFITDAGACVEVAHDSVFLVELKGSVQQNVSLQAARSAKPIQATLRAVAGRPMGRDFGKAFKITFKPNEGMKLKRMKVDTKSLEAGQTKAVAPKFQTSMAIDHLVSVDGDGKGGLVVGAQLLRSKRDPAGGPSLIIGRLSATDTAAAPLLTDALTLSDSSFAYVGQPYVVAPDGRIFQPVASQQGYTIVIHPLPGSTQPAVSPAGALGGEVKS